MLRESKHVFRFPTCKLQTPHTHLRAYLSEFVRTVKQINNNMSVSSSARIMQDLTWAEEPGTKFICSYSATPVIQKAEECAVSSDLHPGILPPSSYSHILPCPGRSKHLLPSGLFRESCLWHLF